MSKSTLLGYSITVLIACSCQQDTKEPTRPQMYDYMVSVEETAMSQPQTILQVQTGQAVEGVYRDDAHSYLFIYETIYPKEEANANGSVRVRYVPQDTLVISLTRKQTDTIYYLARRVFSPPAQPPLRDSLQPPRFYQMHDIDPYIVVRLRPAVWSGPYYTASGYQEENGAGYVLRDYLLKLRRSHPPVKKPDIIK